ncbi:olfactory receptor 1019-like [Spea bombifrons]|uniref:olfactory receptor 1019-like n=1 Tax=Spea bombifrons TaxID=233779 RepID=UPI0023497C31|nr:olfactory receptor 1019-like [Spea bombifrons]
MSQIGRSDSTLIDTHAKIRIWKGMNITKVNEFILMGLSERQDLQIFLFMLFLMIYLITILGNVGIIIIVYHNSQLHTPMYFFISSLSFLDLCYSSDIAPKMIVDLLSAKRNISYIGCALQLFFFTGLGCTESFLFAVMAYDRYVAICNPLNYSLAMQPKTCLGLVSGAYTAGFLHSVIETCCTFSLSFCASNILNHFACDFPPLFSISCTDTAVNELILFVFASSVTMSSILVIFVSYLSIFLAILKIKAVTGRKKAFSTCSSHITAITLFYSTVIYVYLKPTSKTSVHKASVATVFYTVVIPMLNPMIYSLRNKDIKVSLKSMLQNTIFIKRLK